MDSDKPEKLTRAFIDEIAWNIREGEASPDDANSLLECFCNAVDNKETIPPELLNHLRDAFRTFLSKEKSIEVALGITRKKGRPKADSEVKVQMATEILRCRLDGTSHQDALTSVADAFGWGETIVGEAWAKWQQDAIIMLRLERSLENYPWTPGEVLGIPEHRDR